MYIEDQISILRECIIDLQNLARLGNDKEVSAKIKDISKRMQHALNGEYQD